MPVAFRQLLCHAVNFKKLFKPLSLLLLKHLLLFSQLLDAKVILFGFGHFSDLTSSKKKKKERKRCAGSIYLAIVIVYRAVLPDENCNHQKIVDLHKYNSFLVNCLPIGLPF